MSQELLVSSTSLETRLVILEDDLVTEIFVERAKDRGILGNIYKGRVTRVLPGMQAAFVNIGLERDAFLYVADFFEDYEEYEALFSADEEEEYVHAAGGGERRPADSRAAAGQGKRRPRQPRKTGPDGGDATTSGPPPGRSTPSLRSREPAPPPSRSRATGPVEQQPQLPRIGEILPETLETSVDPDEGFRAEGSEAGKGEKVQILPDYLDSVVNYEAQESTGPELPDEDARLDDKSDLPRLTAPRDGRRSKRNNSDPKEGQVLIGDLLRQGQEVLVQVAKEPIGQKGSRITSHVVLPGRYVVFMPTVEHVGVSRRIVSDKERSRLKGMVLKLRGDGKGFIVRTVAQDREESDFARDMSYLIKLWEDVRRKAEGLKAPALVYAEPKLVYRVVRDYFSDRFQAIRVDDEQEYERIVDFVSRFNPDLVRRVRLYNKKTPLFEEYGVNAEIEKALRQKVWLKNGGYIVINQTEALVVIDVNTGKFVGKTNSLEDTITKTNLGAVREVVRQLRLRNLGGIIVVDFIDMDERKNRVKVLEELQRELAHDKAPSKILPFNEFGLVAITRRRVKQSLERVLCQPCTCCNGTGMTKSVRSICYSIHEEIRKMIPSLRNGREILIRCHPDVSRAIRNEERAVLKEIEDMTNKPVSVKKDPLMHIEQFDVVEA